MELGPHGTLTGYCDFFWLHGLDLNEEEAINQDVVIASLFLCFEKKASSIPVSPCFHCNAFLASKFRPIPAFWCQ
jgi:hypothetical protein